MTTPHFKMAVRAGGDWGAAHKTLKELTRNRKFMANIIATEARHAAHLVRRNLETRGRLTGTTWPPLKKLTLKLKKDKRTLIETAQLYKAIDATKHGDKWFIGVSSKAVHKGKGGRISMASLAEVHEMGATIVQTWTPKQMRAFFALLAKAGLSRRPKVAGKPEPVPTRDARGRFLKKPPRTAGKTVVIRIPARPFVGPVLERLYIGATSEVEKRILKAVKSALKLSNRAAKKVR